MQDRRKYKRLRYGVDIEISYYSKRPGGGEVVRDVRTEDICAGGVRVAVPNRFDAGALVSVRLTMPYGEKMACFGQIAWVRPAGKGGFETGIIFVNLSRKEAEAIDRFVEEELEKGIE